MKTYNTDTEEALSLDGAGKDYPDLVDLDEGKNSLVRFLKYAPYSAIILAAAFVAVIFMANMIPKESAWHVPSVILLSTLILAAALLALLLRRDDCTCQKRNGSTLNLGQKRTNGSKTLSRSRKQTPSRKS